MKTNRSHRDPYIASSRRLRRRVCAAFLTATVAVVATASSGVAGVDPLLVCQSKKLKSAATFAKKFLGCDSKAAKTGGELDAACVSKAASKLSAGFSKADAGGCDGDADGAQALIGLAATDLVAAVMPGGLGSTAEICAALKLKSSGKYASGRLKAESKHAKKPDDAKRTASLAKARAKLDSDFEKIDLKGGCAVAFSSEQGHSVIAPAAASVLDCVLGTVPCAGGTGTVGPGGTVTTDIDADGATSSDPMEAAVTTPNAGTIVITKSPLGNAPGGIRPLGRKLDIGAPAASPSTPLAIEFVLDASEVAGLVPGDLLVFRDGALLPDCSGAPGQASPDPCVETRTLLGDGDFSVLALSSEASPWIVGVSAGCPTSMRLTSKADDGVSVTGSNIELGWTGFSHNNDPLDGHSLGVLLDCPGVVGPGCGTCTILGIDALSGACRCSNDNQTHCDVVNGPDADDCGGAACNCYAAAPQPISAANLSVCVLQRLANDIAGTWDPDVGEGAFDFDQRWQVHIGGASLEQPCPICVGDPTPNDGVAGGTCVGGLNDTQGCDANGSDPVLAAGGGTSLDCLPNPATNISAVGLGLDLPMTTGTSSLSFDTACDAPLGFFSCACAVCSGDTTLACRNDAECVAAGAGLCTSVGGGAPRQPNGCNDLMCTATVGDKGECQTAGGPTDLYCDGILRVDGGGLLVCANNTDCTTLGPAYGDCLLSETRRCFLDPIVATGFADPTDPRLVATTCAPPTASAAVNASHGIPGPVRLNSAVSLEYDQSDCPTSLTFASRADDGVVTTGSNVEIGWRGINHNSDPIDDARFRIGINCGTTLPPCGSCSVTGLLPTTGTCRCASDNRAVCDVVNGPDADDCGGGTCNCYTGAPQPISSANIPVCVVQRFESDITGVWDPLAGDGSLQADQRWLVHLGAAVEEPCPVCTGDATPNDGVRDGTCVGGANNGQTCDTNGLDGTLAIAGGTSLDCFPNPLTNTTGAGLKVTLPLTTGAVSLPFGDSCDFPYSGFNCACGACSLDPTLACNGDTDCSSVAAGVCGAGSAPPRGPNSCANLVCSPVPVGGETGRCLGMDGPTDQFCDGILRPDGEGVGLCFTNADCAAYGPGFGDCTQSTLRRCFLNPIEATGEADQTDPLLVATTCLTATANNGVNSGNGLPGAARLALRFAVSTP